MTRIIATLVLGVLVLTVVIVGVGYYNSQTAKLQVDGGRAKIRAEYLERAGAINAASNEDRHREELASLVKWYDSALADLYNQFPGIHDPDSRMHEFEGEVATGKMSAADMAKKKEWYDEAKNLYDAVEHGKYAPIMTTVQEGIRIDLLDIKRVNYEGASRLRMDVVTWGAPRRETATAIERGLATHTKMELDFGFRSIDFEYLTDLDDKDKKAQAVKKAAATPKKKMLGGLEIIRGPKVADPAAMTPPPDKKLLGGGNTGAPTMVVDNPEYWIPDFPPQVALMIWYIDPAPAETKEIDMKISGDVRSPTTSAFSFTQAWSLVPQPDWLVHAGEEFKGEERMMPKEDLDRTGHVQK